MNFPIFFAREDFTINSDKTINGKSDGIKISEEKISPLVTPLEDALEKTNILMHKKITVIRSINVLIFLKLFTN